MKKTMFKKVLAGIAAMFMMCMFLPMCSMTNASAIGITKKATVEGSCESGVYRVRGGNNIKDYIIDNAFVKDNFSEATDLTIENCTIQNGALNECLGLKNLTLNNCRVILNPFNVSVTNPSTSRIIEEYAFPKCIHLETITLGDNFTINSNAFAGCSGLKSVTMGKKCTIEGNVFSNSDILETVIIGDDCIIKKGLERFVIMSLTNMTIGTGCTGYEQINCWPKNVTIGDNYTIDSKSFEILNDAETVKIGNNCTIKSDAFSYCTNLKTVGLGNDCTIESNAFWECNRLKNVAIGNNCTIESKMFEYFQNINNVEIGDGINIVDEESLSNENDRNKTKANNKNNRNEETKKANNRNNKNENTTDEEDTASTFSDGSVLAVVGCSTFLVLCGLAAVIIVKRRKKTQ